jgi:hypothetical protein
MSYAADYLKYRGKCKEEAEKLIEKYPGLRLVRGHYHCPIDNHDHQHWWCVTSKGDIIDPTLMQFHSRGEGIYTEFTGITECSYCGKEIEESEIYACIGNEPICSYECYGKSVL